MGPPLFFPQSTQRRVPWRPKMREKIVMKRDKRAEGAARKLLSPSVWDEPLPPPEAMRTMSCAQLATLAGKLGEMGTLPHLQIFLERYLKEEDARNLTQRQDPRPQNPQIRPLVSRPSARPMTGARNRSRT
jgi:hypothetical protein